MRKSDDWTITDARDAEKEMFCACLVPDDATMRDAHTIKARWLEQRTADNFGAKTARLPDGTPAGMIQYLPIQESSATGEGLWFVYCIWIPPKKRSTAGQQRKKGMGKALLQAAEEDVRARGAKGLAAWGMTIPVFMQSAWFRKQGYRTADRQGVMELVWKPFTEDATPPRWLRGDEWRVITETVDSGKKRVLVKAFRSGICPAMNAVHERFVRAAEQLGDTVRLETVDMNIPDEKGPGRQIDAVFINGHEFPMGPPASYKKILARLRKEGRKATLS